MILLLGNVDIDTLDIFQTETTQKWSTLNETMVS